MAVPQYPRIALQPSRRSRRNADTAIVTINAPRRKASDPISAVRSPDARFNTSDVGARTTPLVVPSEAHRRESDTLQVCHWTISLLKRWLLGTHAGAVGAKHLQAYLDEDALRHNRRKTNGVGRIAARVIEQLVACQPSTRRSLIDDTRRCRWFRQPEPTA